MVRISIQVLYLIILVIGTTGSITNIVKIREVEPARPDRYFNHNLFMAPPALLRLLEEMHLPTRALITLETTLALPPDIHPDVEQLTALLQSTGSEDAKKYGPEVFEKMGSYHPKELHWYLPLLGVDPLHHGEGLGSALKEHALGRCDQDKKIRISRIIKSKEYSIL